MTFYDHYFMTLTYATTVEKLRLAETKTCILNPGLGPPDVFLEEDKQQQQRDLCRLNSSFNPSY